MKQKPETLYVKASFETGKGDFKGGYAMTFRPPDFDTPLIVGYVSKETLDALRAAQPLAGCQECGKGILKDDLICGRCQDHDIEQYIAKARAEGIAQGKTETDDKYKSRLTVLEKRIKEMEKWSEKK